MAEKELEAPPPAHCNAVAVFAAEESAMTADQLQARRLRRKRFNQLVATLVICALIISAISVTLDHTVFNFTTPKYRLSSLQIRNLNLTNSTTSSSFTIELTAQIAMKNRNFAPYKYEWGYLTFSYGGVPVGDSIVERWEVKRRSSESRSVMVNVTSKAVTKGSNLRGDIIGSGRLRFSVESELRGQIEMMKIIRKDRVVVLDCDVTIDLGAKTVQQLSCD